MWLSPKSRGQNGLILTDRCTRSRLWSANTWCTVCREFKSIKTRMGRWKTSRPGLPSPMGTPCIFVSHSSFSPGGPLHTSLLSCLLSFWPIRACVWLYHCSEWMNQKVPTEPQREINQAVDLNSLHHDWQRGSASTEQPSAPSLRPAFHKVPIKSPGITVTLLCSLSCFAFSLFVFLLQWESRPAGLWRDPFFMGLQPPLLPLSLFHLQKTEQ